MTKLPEKIVCHYENCDHDMYDEDGKGVNKTGTFTKRIRQDVFTPIIIKAIQELAAKVKVLEDA